MESTYQPTSGGSANGAASTLTYYYDPQVEFLELGQLNNGTDRTWKVYGPDKSGVYGGAQGIGGLENEVDEGDTFGNVPINNFFGDAVGETFAEIFGPGAYGYETYTYGLTLGGYGPEPDTYMNVQTPEWRGHYADYDTGFVYFGARYYEARSGRFLSADPMGHASSMSLYDYCNGDPVNGLDPDGRVSSPFANNFEGPAASASEVQFDNAFINDAQAVITSPWTSGQQIGNALGNGTFDQTIGNGLGRIYQSADNLYNDPGLAWTNTQSIVQSLDTPQGAANGTVVALSFLIPGAVGRIGGMESVDAEMVDEGLGATSWQQHEDMVTQSLQAANPGTNIGEQVTLDVTNQSTGQTVTIRIDKNGSTKLT